MTLCATCKSIDFRPLLIACLQQCRDRQEANGEDYDAPLPFDNSSRVKHYDDIFEIEKSSGECNFCKVIFQAVGITSSWCYPMSATADKSTGTATDFVAYCHTMRLKGFLRPCDGEKILVKDFSL
jgi:hypothetical protein